MANTELGSTSDFMPVGMLPTHHAIREPNRPMITHDGVTVTRIQFEEAANRRARALERYGIRQDDIVSIALPNSIAFYETVFAVWKLGATPNIVSSRLPGPELQSIIDLAQPRLVIGVGPERLSGHELLPLDWQVDQSLSAEPLGPRMAACWKIMTSGGSTGRPKLIVDQSPSVWSPGLTMYNQRVDDVVLNPGPLYHGSPFGLVMIAPYTGAHVVEMGKFDPLRALELIDEHKVTWVNFVPTMMSRIDRLPEAEKERHDLSSLHTVFHMSSACPPWLKERWIEWLGPDRIWELYGSTERVGQTAITGREWLSHRGSVGRPILGAKVKILDEHGGECASGEVGEIFFMPAGGEHSTYRYVGAEPKTRDGWHSVGDLGYLDAEGYLYLVDRRTDLIICGGANIYPAEVEGAIEAHPSVVSSLVIGLPDADLGHVAHALVEVAPDQQKMLDAEGMRAFLAERIVSYKIPRSFEFVTEALRDDGGKARRRAFVDARAAAH